MWGAAPQFLIIWYGWYMNGGDISYGRLNKNLPLKSHRYRNGTPLLLLLTRIGVPLSTSLFGSQSAFASTFVLEKMLVTL